jgi:hypothetical protein
MFFSKLFRRTAALFALAGACLLAPAAHASVVLQVSGGKLTGATGVVVDGNTYSVEFRDGLCKILFSNCSVFTFTTSIGAEAASHALLDQVFVNGLLGNFDDRPELTTGCTSVNLCLALTPFEQDESGFIVAGFAVNRNQAYEAIEGFEDDTMIGKQRAYDTTLDGVYVYAVWAKDATVPEPGTLPLLGLAGAGLARTQRRRTIAAKSVQ